MPPPPVTSLPKAYMLLPTSPFRYAMNFGAIDWRPLAISFFAFIASLGAGCWCACRGIAAAIPSMKFAELAMRASL
jgi:hypothetical protein